MKKVNLKLIINDFVIEEEGFIEENILFFSSDNVKYEFNIEDLVLKRENDEFLSIISFKKEKDNNFYLLKEVSKEIINNLVIKELQVLENMFIIRYEIEEVSYNFSLKYEEV